MKNLILSRSEKVIKSEIAGIEQELRYHQEFEAINGRRSLEHNVLSKTLASLELELIGYLK